MTTEPVAPFTDDEEAKQTGAEVAAFIARGMVGVKEGDSGIKTFDQVERDGTPALIDKELLENQAFVVLNVTTRIGGATIPDTGEVCDLVLAAVQPVMLSDAGKVSKAGNVCIIVAGNDRSVLGQEMQQIEAAGESVYPVQFKNGLIRKSARQGDYYTVQGKITAESANKNAVLWGD